MKDNLLALALSSDTFTPANNVRGVFNELYKGSLDKGISKQDIDWYSSMFFNRTILILTELDSKFRTNFLNPTLNAYYTDERIILYDPYDPLSNRTIDYQLKAAIEQFIYHLQFL